ncbi:MAG: glycosyltransferase family 2 protein [Prevotella sp.]|jgi:glycosyltransferase involved in cell wall biosynthesis|nr:glycosyltransferase family 2 protein [Prevotella sp.]
MNSKNYNYSIIIPHKNIPKLLQRCLDSIPVRDDIQIIIVDDNSNPAIVDFNNFPGHDRKGVECYFTKKGEGGGYARNFGLQKAKGKWILFADADDFFTYCLSDILNQYVNDSHDVIYFNANSVDSETYLPSFRVNHLNRYISWHQNNPSKSELYLRYKFGEPWCKMIRYTLIEDHKIRFDEIPIHNDTRFSYLVGFYAPSVCVDNRAVYCVTNRPKSVSKLLDAERSITRVKVFVTSDLFFTRHHIPLHEDWQFIELLDQYKANKNLYHKEKGILLNFGYTSFKIYSEMLSIQLNRIKIFFKTGLHKVLHALSF